MEKMKNYGDLSPLKGMGLHNLAGLTKAPSLLERIECYLRLHKWKKTTVTRERPTVANNGLWKYQSMNVCKQCNALKGPVKEGSCYVYIKQNKER